jgi:hypothetical protein
MGRSAKGGIGSGMSDILIFTGLLIFVIFTFALGWWFENE